jgi:hypothetical protein
MIKNTILWLVTQCSLVDTEQHSGGTCCPVTTLYLKIKVASSSQTLICFLNYNKTHPRQMFFVAVLKWFLMTKSKKFQVTQ